MYNINEKVLLCLRQKARLILHKHSHDKEGTRCKIRKNKEKKDYFYDGNWEKNNSQVNLANHK